MPRFARSILIVISIGLLKPAGLIDAQDNSSVKIRHSDIFINRARSENTFEQYRVDGLVWGFLPHPLNSRTIKKWTRNAGKMQDMGLKFQGRIEFDARWENMIDYDPDGFMNSVMRTLDGELLIAPWFAKRSYKGHPAYWFCSNAPGFREYLNYQADIVVSGNPDYILLDAQTSTSLPLRWYGACFCEHCLAGFRDYLGRNYPADDLRAMGVDDLSGFNYAGYLKSRGYNDETFIIESRKYADGIPMIDAYRKYHLWTVNDLTGKLSRHIDWKAGRHITLSTSSPPHQPYRRVMAPEVSHYTLEMGQDADTRKVPYRTILKYRIAEAVHKKVILTALPKQDWKIILDENRPGLVRTWIAQAYACGANFMVPVKQWASEQYTYKGKPEDFQYLYDFIHENSGLLDGYEALAGTGLLLSGLELEKNQAGVESLVRFLTFENIPFRIVFAGIDDWDYQFTKSDLEGLSGIIKPSEDKFLTGEQWNLIESSGIGLVEFTDSNTIMEDYGHLINVSSGNRTLSVLSRYNRDSENVPVVFHLLNRQYDEKSDSVIPVRDISLILHRSMIDDVPAGFVLYRPGKDPLELIFRNSGQEFRIRIPEIEEWGIIALKAG